MKLDLKNRIENVDFTFIKFIRDETKSFSNKVIFFSIICILLNSNIITIQELELDGFKINIKEYILAGLVLFINIYFYLQFLNSAKIDLLISKQPNELSAITKEVINKSESTRLKMNKLLNEYQEFIDDKNIDGVKHQKFHEAKTEIDNESILQLSEQWLNTYDNLIKYHKINMNLNFYFPNICFWISILVFLIKTINWLNIICFY